MADVTVVLTQREYERLTAKTTATGGLQVLIHTLQRGTKKGKDGKWRLTVRQSDLDKIPRYWKNTGGKPGSGGYQSRLPIRALRPHLRSVAPLFDDGCVDVAVKPWIYFKRAKLAGLDGKIKIGHGNERRSRGGRHTDNPEELVVLLRLRATDEQTERYYHRRFAHLRIVAEQEWFWPGEDLLAFINETSAEQKLQKQRCGDDAAVVGRRPGERLTAARPYSRTMFG